MSVYVVDNNFFIQAHRANYPLDVATSFWSKVLELAEEGKIIKDNNFYLSGEKETGFAAEQPASDNLT